MIMMMLKMKMIMMMTMMMIVMMIMMMMRVPGRLLRFPARPRFCTVRRICQLSSDDNDLLDHDHHADEHILAPFRSIVI